MSRVGLSSRTSWSRTLNPSARAVAQAQAQGTALLDLSEANPTRCGLSDSSVLQLLSDSRGGCYAPQPLGLSGARQAVSSYYESRGIAVAYDRVVLAASTSEAYGWLFKLLCDPSDVVLVPNPAYPLLPMLGQLEGVELRDYPLRREEGWRIDFAALRNELAQAEGRARAIVVVNPSNPTGTFTRRDEAEALIDIAREHEAALIVDEVFADYPHQPLPADRRASFADVSEGLCFVLSGLSKVALLPQLKLSWLVCSGPQQMVAEVLGRLELISDCYLSVSTAAQLALAPILARRERLQAPMHRRLATNLAALDRAIEARGSTCPVRRLPTDGGWYALVEVPRSRSDDEWVTHLVQQAGVLVHPGYFFDMEQQGTMVVSLIGEPEPFTRAITAAVQLWSSA